MKRRLTNIILFLLLPMGLSAQIDLVPLSSLYMFNGLTINPAYAGSHEVLSGIITYRKQWAGFDGAPDDKTFALHTPISFNGKSDNFSALGLQGAIQTGPGMNNGEVYVDYAFHIKLPQGNSRLVYRQV